MMSSTHCTWRQVALTVLLMSTAVSAQYQGLDERGLADAERELSETTRQNVQVDQRGILGNLVALISGGADAKDGAAGDDDVAGKALPCPSVRRMGDLD